MLSFEQTYKGVRIKIITGDITKMKVDAIVNPANSLMFMGGGVAGAIKRAGGAKIETEALKKAPVKVGKAIATKARRLSAKFVIHTPTMARPAMQINKKNVQLAMQSALNCGHSLEITSLAFSGLGTGVGGLSMETAANIMMQTTKSHIDKFIMLKEVIFVGYGNDAVKDFEKAFMRTFKNVGS